MTLSVGKEGVKCQFCGEPATKLRYKPDWFDGLSYDLCDSCADKHNKVFDTPVLSKPVRERI